jgi:hypothetical protein
MFKNIFSFSKKNKLLDEVCSVIKLQEEILLNSNKSDNKDLYSTHRNILNNNLKTLAKLFDDNDIQIFKQINKNGLEYFEFFDLNYSKPKIFYSALDKSRDYKEVFIDTSVIFKYKDIDIDIVLRKYPNMYFEAENKIETLEKLKEVNFNSNKKKVNVQADRRIFEIIDSVCSSLGKNSEIAIKFIYKDFLEKEDMSTLKDRLRFVNNINYLSTYKSVTISKSLVMIFEDYIEDGYEDFLLEFKQDTMDFILVHTKTKKE